MRASATSWSRRWERFEGQHYELPAYVVMNDHVRALLTPVVTYELEGIRILHSWESFTSCQMQRRHRRASGACGRTSASTGSSVTIRNSSRSASTFVANPLKRWPDLKDYCRSGG